MDTNEYKFKKLALIKFPAQHRASPFHWLTSKSRRKQARKNLSVSCFALPTIVSERQRFHRCSKKKLSPMTAAGKSQGSFNPPGTTASN
jgi:hypothetical protein